MFLVLENDVILGKVEADAELDADAKFGDSTSNGSSVILSYSIGKLRTLITISADQK